MGLLTRDKPRPRTIQGSALRASAQRITRDNVAALRRSNESWQEAALAFYSQVGELWFASQFYSRSFAKLELYAAQKNAKGAWERSTDQTALDAIDRIQDPGGGRSQMLSAYGKLMFLAGEAYLLGSIGEYGEQWEMLSPVELRLTDSGLQRRKMPADEPILIKAPDPDEAPQVGDGVAYRLWRPHPSYSGMCDSPVRAVLELCEELLLSQRTARAHLRSRLAGNGILGIPDDLTFIVSEAVPDEDPEEDPTLAIITEAMVTPIEQEDAASAVVPIVVRGQAEALKGIVHIKTHDPSDNLPDLELRKADIERIALGLDIPPEILLGLADANHWSAWQIDEQVWKAHLQPLAQHLVDELTSAYFRPALVALGVENPEDYSIAYNASAIINRPDRGKDAEDAFANAAISYDAYLEAKGFTDADKPDDLEWRKIVGVLLKDGGMAATGIPSLKPERGLTESPGQAQAGIPPVEIGAPADGNNPGAPAQEPALAASARLQVAAEAARMRCAELAGSRIRSKVAAHADLAKCIADVPTRLVAAHLGLDTVEQRLGLDRRSLVAGGGETFAAQIEGWGIEGTKARALALVLELDAAKHLFEVADGPVPVSH